LGVGFGVKSVVQARLPFLPQKDWFMLDCRFLPQSSPR
jgi:hypothetical protein